jgi:class 3 adenylate cyclase/tetratricopeptide (TPR) repeat protein
MLCPNCGTDNEPTRKFCAECGATLALACASCGTPNSPGAKFCGECGSALTDPATAARGLGALGDTPAAARPVAERRLVSVLFADLVGFTTLSEHRDPEETRELLSRYFDTARDVIVRYGGTVEKFIGDAVMAVWGAPVSHEDDAERAVRAGLELVDTVAALGGETQAVDLRLRAAVMTAEAAVTIGAEGQGIVAGDVVNTASRLQAAAAPGTVLVGEATYRAARQSITFADAGEYTLKGRTLPVKGYIAQRVVAGHGGFRRGETLEAPFVGRNDELRLLKQLLHVTTRERRVRLLSIVGTAGIGKSRLAWEFFKYVDGLVETTYWHQGRCPAYGEGVAFWALGEMVRMRARISETEDPLGTREKLSATLLQYVADADERRWIEPRLAHLLGLNGVGIGDRDELFAAWRLFFERISDKGTCVLVFEDMQWADAGLIAFMEHMLTWARPHPILIVSLSRPELLEKRPTWGAGQRNFLSMSLEPLPDEDVRELLSGLAQELPESIVSQVLERAEGIPLYAVETVRMLIDQGHLIETGSETRFVGELERLEVPDSLHALIASRLDALPPAEREALQDASVLGKTFTLRSLAALRHEPGEVLEPHLKQLVEKELLSIEVDPWSPERGQYGFVGTLIPEVAYETLSLRDRFMRHLTAAEYFGTVGDEELASVVASHYIEAYRTAPEDFDASALAAEARRSLLAAAGRAASLGAHDQALAYLERAIAVGGSPDEDPVLWERAADAAGKALIFDVAERYLKRAVDWYEEQGNRSAAARATARLGLVLLTAGYTTAAIDMLERAMVPLADLEADPFVLELMGQLARSFMLDTKPGEAIEWADRTLVGAERLNLLPVIADALITKGVAARDAGRWREGISLVTGGLVLAREEGLLPQQTRALANLCDLSAVSDARAALVAAEEGIALARKYGFREMELRIAMDASSNLVSMGEWDRAHEAASEAYRDDLPPHFRIRLKALLGAITGLRGDEEASKAHFGQVRGLVAEATEPQVRAALHTFTALAALARDDFETAYEEGGLALLLDPTGPYGVGGQVAAVRAALWRRDLGPATDAFRDLERASVYGRWVTCVRETLRAGLVLLSGDTEDAAHLYSERHKELRELKCSFDLALAQLDFIALAPNYGGARFCADEAREILSGLRAKPFLKTLDASLSEHSDH